MNILSVSKLFNVTVLSFFCLESYFNWHRFSTREALGSQCRENKEAYGAGCGG